MHCTHPDPDVVFLLHGGPDFDISDRLPELDTLSDKYYLIYYDPRVLRPARARLGRSREVVTLESEMADLDEVREHFLLDKVAPGHSWGTVPALWLTKEADRCARSDRQRVFDRV